MKKIIILFLIILISCTSDLTEVDICNYDMIRLARLTAPLEDKSQEVMSGVYKVVNGQDLLGDKVAVKWTNNVLCIYSRNDVILTELVGGFIKESILFIGNIRIIRSGEAISLFL